MKKFFSILLIFAILFSTVGITVAKSYCKMKKTGLEITQCCKKKCNTSCCSKTVKVFKLTYDSLPTSISKSIKNCISTFISTFVQSFISFFTVETKISFIHKPPPLIHSFESYFTEVFRI